MERILRIATPDDAPEMLDIYRPYVETTAVSFEVTTPSEAEFRERVASTLERYPWLVAEVNGTIRGYTYASRFKAREAYDWAVETSIYLAESARGRGLGRLLYLELEDILRRQGVLNLNACIACTSRKDDPYLTMGSIHFHERLGYEPVGVFHSCGSKFGRWYDMQWMEKMIGPHEADPTPITPFPQLR